MKRAFLVEVMGRHCGYLALMAGIAGGAEVISIPEAEVDPETVAQGKLRAAYDRGKSHAIAVVAEGAKYDADAMLRHFAEHRGRLGFDLRATKLGHVQRGGAPGVFAPDARHAVRSGGRGRGGRAALRGSHRNARWKAGLHPARAGGRQDATVGQAAARARAGSCDVAPRAELKKAVNKK